MAETLKYMEENDLIEKTIIEENPRIKTEYSLTEKGRKTNKILYEITSYYFNELNYVGYDYSQKEDILNEYKKAFEIK